MKANAPERIWIDSTNDLSKLSGHIDKDSVEYIRKDAFIEKAVTYLEATLFNEVCYGEIRPDIVQAYINDFKKVMKL